MLFEGLMGA